MKHFRKDWERRESTVAGFSGAYLEQVIPEDPESEIESLNSSDKDSLKRKAVMVKKKKDIKKY